MRLNFVLKYLHLSLMFSRYDIHFYYVYLGRYYTNQST